MEYFSGFCLHNEQALFDEYLIQTDYSVAGFSYGAIKAFEAVYDSSKRVDTLQLISPAFFQTQAVKLKRMQLMFFKKDANAYCAQFLTNVSKPSNFDMTPYFNQGSYEELEELLNYEWSELKLQELIDRGVKIEVYLGNEDQIIDAKKACEFFKNYATVYYLKKNGHILKSKES